MFGTTRIYAGMSNAIYELNKTRIYVWMKYNSVEHRTYKWNRFNVVTTITYKWNKFNSVATTTYKWRRYSVNSSYRRSLLQENLNEISKDLSTRIRVCNSFYITSDGLFATNDQYASTYVLQNIYDDADNHHEVGIGSGQCYIIDVTNNRLYDYGILMTASPRLTVSKKSSNSYFEVIYSYGGMSGTVAQADEYYASRTYSQGTYIDQVTSTNQSAYPSDGQSGNYWYVYDSSSVSYSKGSAAGTATSTNKSAYPSNGRHSDGYWYEANGSTTSYSKGTANGSVTSANSGAYPSNGRSGNYWYVANGYDSTYSRGTKVGTVNNKTATTYPNDKRHTDGFWYVKLI